MSKKTNPARKSENGGTAAPRKRAFTAGLLVLVAGTMLAGLWWAKIQPAVTSDSKRSPPELPGGSSTNSTSVVPPEYQKLTGTWVRPDGGYILEIRSVDNIGILNAAYFNPDPIHVSKAIALRDGGTTQVFVELQDVNYPGCTYSLVYDPASDRLSGDYYQAAVREHYDVEFSRKP